VEERLKRAGAQPPSIGPGERRLVSVLVADIRGSTPIAEKLGPERYKLLFDEVTRLLRQEVERLGGTVAQLTGDGVLALFGAPIAHEDDAERAVNAALAIHDSLARYDADVGPAYGIELRARVAVNTGPVVVPAGDEPPERLYNALGQTVTVAARLEGIAGERGVCVGEQTARLLGKTFELEPLAEVDLKGISGAVSAFLVAGAGEAAPAQPTGPLIARESELRELEAVLDGLLEGAGAVVSITGEPGIGKSRLFMEARERYADRVRVLEGHALAGAEERPYWSIRELLRDWLRLGLSDPEARVRLELRAALARTLGDDAEEAYPFLATLLGLGLEGEQALRIEELSRDSIQRQTVDWLVRLLVELSHEQPVCLALEDLEAADEATLGLLDELLNLTEEEPVALVLLHRSDPEHEAWHVVDRARRRHRHRFLELELGPLGSEAARELAAVRADAELAGEVGDILIERSGGNPFFLEEALRDLVERGGLVRKNGRVHLAADFDRLAVPALVHEALQARFDRLEPSTRELLALAAVTGRSFGLPLLERLFPRERLTPALAELQRLELVVEERRRPAREYRFRHGVVQEVAYATLTEARRRQLHLQVGEALEEINRDSPEEVYGALAHHFSQADEPARAAKYLLGAGDAARMLYADQEAIAYYRAALAFLERFGDTERARETLLRIALTHHLAFDFGRAGRAYEDAFSRLPPQPRRLQPSHHLRTAVGAPPHELVPGMTYYHTSSYLVGHLYRGLVAVGRKLEIVPDLAESFSVSDDGRSYRFRIHPDAVWSDGVAVSADDFAFTWSRMREDEVRTAFLLEDITAAEAVDARTLEIRLHQPRNYFLHLLAGPAFYAWPRHVYERLGPRWFEVAPLVGNGPFVLTELNEERATLVANDVWPGPRGNVRSIDVEFLPGSPQAAAAAAWQEGRYDALPLEFDVGATFDRAIVESASGLGTTYLAFRADREPFDDIRVRTAFAHALDRGRLLAKSGVLAYAAGRGGFIPPAMPGHSHRVTPGLDPERARQLLSEAGYFRRQRDPVVIAQGEESVAQVGAELVTQLGEVGVSATCREVSFAGQVDDDADAFIYGWMADYPDPDGMLRPFLADRRILRDRHVEELIEQARSVTDREARLALYREAERLWLGEQVALVPLTYVRHLSVRRPWIDGLWANALTTATLAEAVVRRY
jgi:ABC-type transport system substrate-binding protein/class 3 adenylate cyclase